VRQSALDFVEGLRIGRIATKLMIKLASTVVVTGPSRQHTQAVGQHAQLSTDLIVVILMINLYAIKSMITDKGLEHVRRQQMLTPATPGMGDHGEASCLMDQVDPAFQLDRVARYVRGAPIGQKAIERLLPISNMPGLDQRVGYVWATDGRTVAYLSHYLRLADRHAERGKLGEHPGQPAQPTVTDTSHLHSQAGTVRISTVRQDVHAVAVTRAGELHPTYHLDAHLIAFGDRFVESVKGVVVGKSHHV